MDTQWGWRFDRDCSFVDAGMRGVFYRGTFLTVATRILYDLRNSQIIMECIILLSVLDYQSTLRFIGMKDKCVL